jgi:hypothetical protein
VWPISHSAQQCGHPALISTPSSDIGEGWGRRLCYFWLETWGAKSSNGSISLLNGYFVSVPCAIRSEAIVGMGKYMTIFFTASVRSGSDVGAPQFQNSFRRVCRIQAGTCAAAVS